MCANVHYVDLYESAMLYVKHSHVQAISYGQAYIHFGLRIYYRLQAFHITFFHSFFFLLPPPVLGIKPRTLHMLGKCSITELHSQPQDFHIKEKKYPFPQGVSQPVVYMTVSFTSQLENPHLSSVCVCQAHENDTQHLSGFVRHSLILPTFLPNR